MLSGIEVEDTIKALQLLGFKSDELSDILVNKLNIGTKKACEGLDKLGIVSNSNVGTVTKLGSSFKGLWSIIKANPIIWVVGAITAAVTVFNAFSDAAEEATQRAEENFSKLTETAKSATETRESVGSLIEKTPENSV